MRNNKSISVAFMVVVMLVTAGIAFASTGSTTISASDLGVSAPTLLPTSPFYFFKDLGRNIQLFFTFNSVNKAKLELKFADEKVIEAQAVIERSPENKDALTKAIANYKAATDRLSTQLQSLRDTSQNPNVNTLLQQVSDRVVKHEKLFEDLKNNVASDTAKDLGDAQDELAKGLLGTAGKLEGTDKLVARLQKAAGDATTTNDLENIQKVELFDRLENAAESDSAKSELRKTREGFSDNIKNILEEALKSTTTSAVLEQLKAIPGDESLRAQIIQEIKSRVPQKDQGDFEDIQKGLENSSQGGNQMEQAQEQIKSAGEKIAELDKKITEITASQVTSPVTDMLSSAKDKLDQAQKAFDAANYGEAFGQARAAEVLARNALRMVDKGNGKENGGGTEKSKTADIKECGPEPLRPTPQGCTGPVCKDGKWEFLCPGSEKTSSQGDNSENESDKSGMQTEPPQQKETPDIPLRPFQAE